MKGKIKEMSEKVKLSNDLEFFIASIKEDPTNNKLIIVVHDVSRSELEAAFSNSEATAVIALILFDDTNEVTQKKFAKYTTLSSMNTDYRVVTSIDYDTEDSSTDSGFKEIKSTVSTITLSKKTIIESTIEDIQGDQAAQDSAIEELASIVSSGGDA